MKVDNDIVMLLCGTLVRDNESDMFVLYCYNRIMYCQMCPHDIKSYNRIMGHCRCASWFA